MAQTICKTEGLGSREARPQTNRTLQLEPIAGFCQTEKEFEEPDLQGGKDEGGRQGGSSQSQRPAGPATAGDVQAESGLYWLHQTDVTLDSGAKI